MVFPVPFAQEDYYTSDALSFSVQQRGGRWLACCVIGGIEFDHLVMVVSSNWPVARLPFSLS